MAQSTRDIRRRIRGVSSTRQITNAMELVSTVKLRQSRKRLQESRPYYTTVLENIQNVLANTGNIKHPYLDKREVNSVLYIVLAADRGLAGGYNSNVINLVEGDIRKRNLDAKIIAVGVRAREYFKRRKHELVGEVTGISEEPSYADAAKIGRMALELYEKGQVDEINIVYSRFVSTISQQPEILKLLPAEGVEGESKVSRKVTEFEPSAEEVLDFLIPKYIQSTIFGTLIEASSSEQAARRVAMESATENAEEIIDELEISYNRARQAAITVEISEIVAGAEALK